MGPKQWLRYLLIHFLCFKGLNVLYTPWTAEVPQTISALRGSCVVVPCKFNYPGPKKESSDLTGIWHTKNQDQFVYHPNSSKVMKTFKGRTILIGDLRRKDCSLRINHLDKKDSGQFFFRIEIIDLDKYSYKDNVVSIDVQDSPASPLLTVGGEFKAGQAVTASCSVSHSCPTDPPQLTWSHTGTSIIQSEQLTNGQWRVTSVLTFTATNTDHNKNLTCMAEYQQDESVHRSKILNVKYAPEIKVGSACTSETTGVACLCVVDSEPAPEVTWLLPRGTSASSSTERHGSITLGTLRSSQRLTEITCRASNSEGNTTAAFSAPQSDKLLYTLITVVLIVAAMAVLLWLVKRKRSNHGQPGMDAAGITMTRDSCTMRARKEGKRFDTGLYVNNYPMYGNTEVGEDYDVYECVEDATD